MYEIRKWVNKPILKEVLYTNINFQALEETLAEKKEKDNLSEEEFFEQYEIEEATNHVRTRCKWRNSCSSSKRSMEQNNGCF